MKNLLILTMIIAITTIPIYSTDVNGRFLVITNNGINYTVRLQLNTNTGIDDLGGATIVFNFNKDNLSFPSSPQSGVDYTYHNFSGGTYSVGTVTRPLTDQIWLNIELNTDNGGTVVSAAPSWTDVVTINFTTLIPSGNANLIWQTSDGNWFIFDGDNATLWDNGTFTNENTTPLPVELTSFTSNVISDRVQLNWQTKTEVNNYGFEIERASLSASPLPVWEKIGFVNGNGNSNSPKDYLFVDKNFIGGSKFNYRLKQIDNDGQFEYSEMVEVQVVPNKFELYQNYPNPFNPSTKIRYQLPNESKVVIKIYNILGSEVMELVNSKKEAGVYEAEFNAASLSSGTYIYKISADNFVQTKKMILLK